MQSIAQVPAEEFSMNETCSDSQIKSQEKADGNRTLSEKDEYLIYNNASLGFKIEYPIDWKGLEKHCMLEAIGLIQTSSTINFMSVSNSSKYGLLGIMVGDFLPKLSIDEFVNVYSKDFGHMIESKEIITLDGIPSVKFIMNDGNNNKFTQITTLVNEKKYDITYPIVSWLSNSTIQHMLQSFEILDNNQKNTINSEITESNELG
jgi:hypothetical protein